MKEQEVLDLVKNNIDANENAKTQLQTADMAIRRDNDWFYITIKPINPEMRVSKYNSLLVELEEQLEKQADVNVLFVPVLPD